MAKKAKRQKAIKRLNLSDHTLDINIRKCNYSKFNFSDVEDYVHELVGLRDYQYDAIKNRYHILLVSVQVNSNF